MKLLQNVRIFDRRSAKLSAPSNVLIVGNTIERVSTDAIPVMLRADTVVIDSEGMTLMPGLIDAQVHLMLQSLPLMTALTADVGYLHIVTAQAAEAP